MNHKTYHHFTGDGISDSEIDVILCTPKAEEYVTKIICKKEYPFFDSHHDIIISKFLLPQITIPEPNAKLIAAPRIALERQKVIWSDEGIADFQNLVSPHLKRLRAAWIQSPSKSLFSVLLTSTNDILTKASSETNQTIDINLKHTIKSVKKPAEVEASEASQKKSFNSLQTLIRDKSSSPDQVERARLDLKLSKKYLRQTIRRTNLRTSIKRDERLSDISSKNPAAVHSFIKSSKNSSSSQIQKLVVGDIAYQDEHVPDGFFASMSKLKSCNFSEIRENPALSQQLSDYDHIIKLASKLPNIPPITRKESDKLIKRIRQNVKDLFSITALHYINAGNEGLEHYNFLLNCIIQNIELAEVVEFNIAHGLIIHKGHGKDKNSDRSYRTISTCPFLAKSLDLYTRDLYCDLLDDQQAPTQYFGSGSSHELASLLVTETIQYSLYNSDKPVFLLFLDAQSAFDKVIPQLLVRNLFFYGIDGTTLSYINSRLTNRSTVYEWDKVLLGPSKDDTGVEQGGVPSGDFYKVHNNEQLLSAQASNQGVNIGSSTISSAGQADDVMLPSNDIFSLQNLINLTTSYCTKFNVLLCPEKTKLLVISSKANEPLAEYSKQINPININGFPIDFTSSAVHVGVIRSSSGNLPHILTRITEHKKALGSVLSAGMARGHRGNPSAAIKVEKLYACPVLMSGLASLRLSQTEITSIDNHYKTTLEGLLKLHPKTPSTFVFFISGSLPAIAILHLRQLSLFSMICRLTNDPLNLHARHTLAFSKPSTKSWFHQVREICLQYSLPHPLSLLDDPPKKEQFKKLTKSRVHDFWECKLRKDASSLPSLKYFRPTFMSLDKPHPLWTTAGSSPYEVNKACIQAKMMSGRYRTEKLCRFWSNNKEGFCLSPSCDSIPEDIEHILSSCQGLETTRQSLRSAWLTNAATNPLIHQLIVRIISASSEDLCQFILDPSTHPDVINLCQIHGNKILDNIFYLTRTWCHTLHKKRLKILGRFNLK